MPKQFSQLRVNFYGCVEAALKVQIQSWVGAEQFQHPLPKTPKYLLVLPRNSSFVFHC